MTLHFNTFPLQLNVIFYFVRVPGTALSASRRSAVQLTTVRIQSHGSLLQLLLQLRVSLLSCTVAVNINIVVMIYLKS